MRLKSIPGGKAKPKKLEFVCGARGAPKAIPANVEMLLEFEPWAGVLRYNEFAERIEFAKAPPWGYLSGGPGEAWTNADSARLASWIATGTYGFSPTSKACLEGVVVAARQATYHPIRDYLKSLTWDGVPRVSEWLPTYAGAPSNPYVRAAGACLLRAAVQRVMQPGCQLDYIVILEGEQGKKKSSLVRTLASDQWFTDDVGEIGTKDAAIQLLGRWFFELAELDALNRKEATAIKAWATRREDRFRPPFGTIAEEFPRQCVFVGTTNADTYLRDHTGGRRFHPVKVGVTHPIDLEALARDRDQLWAEAYSDHLEGRQWWPDEDVLDLARDEQEQRFEADAWEDAVARILASRLETAAPTTEQILTALGVELKDQDINRQRRLGSVMVRLGYTRIRVRDAQGQQHRAWGRDA